MTICIDRATCSHDFKLMTSTFGSDQGAMCSVCYAPAPEEVYVQLKRRDLQRQIRALG